MAEHNGEFRPTANTSSVGTSTVTQASVTEIEYRIEHDTMGEVRVPKDAKYQAQTQRAVENFPISFRTLEQTQIRALALIKSAAATVNARLGVIPTRASPRRSPHPPTASRTASSTATSRWTSSRPAPAPART